MITVKQFLNDCEDRASNPLISSFIIAWLCFNWRIPVALMFYKNYEIKEMGNLSFIDFIEKNISFRLSIIAPLAIAILYTLFFPYLSGWIKKRISIIKADYTTATLKATTDAYLPVKKILELREQIIKDQKVLRKALEEDSVSKIELELKKTELTKANNDLAEVRNQQKINTKSLAEALDTSLSLKKKMDVLKTEHQNILTFKNFNDIFGKWDLRSGEIDRATRSTGRFISPSLIIADSEICLLDGQAVSKKLEVDRWFADPFERYKIAVIKSENQEQRLINIEVPENGNIYHVFGLFPGPISLIVADKKN